MSRLTEQNIKNDMGHSKDSSDSYKDSLKEQRDVSTQEIYLSSIDGGDNARDLPYDYITFRNVDWPDLSVSAEDASKAHKDIVENGELKDKPRLDNMSVEAAVEIIDRIRDLAISIDNVGLIQYPYVTKHITTEGDRYTCISGNRRISALHYLKRDYATVACNSDDVNELDVLTISNNENNNRVELSFYEQLRQVKTAYDSLCRLNFHPTIDALKKHTGLSKTNAAKFRKIIQSESFDLCLKLSELGATKGFVESNCNSFDSLDKELKRLTSSPVVTSKKRTPSNKNQLQNPITLTRNTDPLILQYWLEVTDGRRTASERFKNAVSNAIGKDQSATQEFLDILVEESRGTQ